MKSAIPAVLVVASLVAALSCGGMPAAPAAAPLAPTPSGTATTTLSVAGIWEGTANDSQGTTLITWVLNQTGSTVSGTVKTQSVDPTDGSCNSCHRNKSGTFTGTLDGTTLTLSMTFAAGVNGDPTPACKATMTGTAPGVATDKISAAFTGLDSCEGPFLNGTLAMRPQK